MMNHEADDNNNNNKRQTMTMLWVILKTHTKKYSSYLTKRVRTQNVTLSLKRKYVNYAHLDC